MGQLRINNFTISTPIIDILYRLRLASPDGKLKDIEPDGENIVVTCPFHSGGHEAKAACNVFVGESDSLPYGYFRCFVCDAKGPFINLVAACLNSSIEFAKEWLLNNFEAKESASIDVGSEFTLRRYKGKFIETLSESALDEFQSWHPYLAQRKLTRETCEKFKLRYDPKYRQIIFPYYDEKGRLTTLLKRAIDSKTFYIESGIEKPVYGINNIVSNNIHKCIITEGPFDCLVANQYGFPAIAMLGNPSPEQIALINKSDISVVYLMFDNDAKGKYFNNLMHNRLAHRILIVDVTIEDPYKDIGDLDYDTFWNFIHKAEQNN